VTGRTTSSAIVIVIACRRSPAKVAGARSAIGSVDVGPAAPIQIWYPDERTTRIHRDLAGIVTITCPLRWADYGIQYASLIARTFDGIVSEDGEASPVDDGRLLNERELAYAWRDLELRAMSAIQDHERALRRRSA
jgi:hypothetical protein